MPAFTVLRRYCTTPAVSSRLSLHVDRARSLWSPSQVRDWANMPAFVVLSGHCNISLPAFHRDRVFKVIGNPAEVRRAARITSRLSLAPAVGSRLSLHVDRARSLWSPSQVRDWANMPAFVVLSGHCNISLPAFHRDRVFKVIGNPAEVRRAARITSRLSLAPAVGSRLSLHVDRARSLWSPS